MSTTTAAAPSDPRAAIGRARADLRLAASKAQLEGDPLGPVLEAFGASLGAMGEVLDHAESSRQPLDASAQAEMTRAKALSKRISQAGLAAKRCSTRRSERCSRKRCTGSTMRGSGLHQRIGSPALYQGNRLLA